MGRQCAIIPKVLNNKGEIVDSRLFKDLLSFLPHNRAEVVRIYRITKNPEFIKEWVPQLTLDSNNEPTLRSMLQKTNLDTIITNNIVLEKLNRDIGYYKRGMDRPALWIKNPENYKKLADKARKFNLQSPFRDEYVAKIVNIYDNESSRVFMGVKVERRNKLNSIEAERLEYNESLNEKLRDILSSHGISVGTLTELERRMGISGVTDFDQAKTAAEGMIEMIRLAEGIRGEKVLPEEFAHWALEALGNDNPIVKRLINLLVSNNLVNEILGDEYETYNSLYNKDKVKLAKEAAGKLLAKHLLKAEPIPQKPYKNLLQRLIAFIKNFFQGLSATSIQKAIKQADAAFGSLARNILDGHLDNDLKLSNITDTNLFFSISERILRDKKLLQKIIDNELKRLKVYETRTSSSTFATNQQELIYDLEDKLSRDNEIEGIYSFMENTLDILGQLDTRLVAVQNTPASTINEKAKVLRDIRNYLYSYQGIIENIRATLVEEENYTDSRYDERAKVLVNNISSLLEDLFIKYRNVSLPLFVDFIKPFLGGGLTIPFGKWKGKTIKAENLVDLAKGEILADKDISFFDRWLDSMADSSDYILKIMDQAVKKSKENARLDTIEINKQLQAATIKLEQAGIKNTDWMFEKGSDGKKTGRYITEINYGLFKEAKRKMYKDLHDKYGDDPTEEDVKAYNREVNAWYEDNMEDIGDLRVPKKSIYGNKVFQNLNEAQKEYWNTVMNIKAKLDSYLPEKYTTLYNTVKIRKDLIERVKSSDSVKSGTTQLWESIKDQFIRRSDDTEFGERATVKDFEGNEVQVLPIYFTKLRKGENPDDVSTDIVGTLTAYAAMANDYKEMNKIIDVLELSRDMLRDNLKITKTRGDKPLVEKAKVMGRTIESKVIKNKDDRRIIQRLNDFFDMQVFGRYLADEGTFGNTKIDKAKTANFVNKVTALNTLALNVLSGVANVATGKVMMRIESIAKEFFTEKNTIIADREYMEAMPEFLAEIGNRVKTNKLALWGELFNVSQDYEEFVRNVNFDRKTWFSRMCNSSAIFFMNHAGEHWLHYRTSLSLGDAYKMRAPDGKIVSLWDAMEVVLIDPKNKALGAKLQVKEGYTKEDGTAFTREDIFKFSRKTAAINHRMHGIYNTLDKSAVQRLAIGRMGMLFRKWIKPSLNRRFGSATYNFDLDAWTEGYYSTLKRFTFQLAKELKEGQFAIAANWNHLTDTEKANIKRALTEIAHFLAIALILAIIDWSDDEDRPWLIRMIEYILRRLYTEIGVMIPGPSMATEGLRILQSPAAGINTIEDILNLIGLVNPYNYEFIAGEEALIQSGRYEGESKAIRLLYESPIIPMNRTIYKGLHPETGIPFYK